MLKIILSFIAGAIISGANIFAIKAIVKNLASSSARLKYGIFAAIKFALLIFLVLAAIKWMSVDVMGFLAGFGLALLVGILFLFRKASKEINKHA